MNDHQPILVAVFSNVVKLDNVLQALEKIHYDRRSVSIITRPDDAKLLRIDPDPGMIEPVDQELEVPPEKAVSSTTLAGGAIGASMGAASLVGPLMVVGPILGLAAGAAAGSLLSAVEHWGIRRDEAERYRARVEAGEAIVIVQDAPSRLTETNRVLLTCDPESVERFEPGETKATK